MKILNYNGYRIEIVKNFNIYRFFFFFDENEAY